MMYDIVIKEGFIILPNLGRKNIGIIDNKISKITSEKIRGDIEINAKNKIIMPEIVDTHVHDRIDETRNWKHKETHQSAARAAVNGGVGSYGVQPNTPRPCIDSGTYKTQLEISKEVKTTRIPYVGLHEGTTIQDLEEVKKLGCFYTKGFTQSVGNLNMPSWEVIEEQRNKVNRTGMGEIWHAEDFEILNENKNKPTHVERRPAKSEISAVSKILEMGYYNLTFAHVTTAKTAEMILKSPNSYMELTPHHLLLHRKLLEGEHSEYEIRFSKLYQMNPALRWEDDAAYLRNLLKNIKACHKIRNGSDHAPHTLKEKTGGMSGVPQLDTLSNIVCELHEKYDIPWENLAIVYAYNPAQFLGLTKQGKIEKGMNASLTLLDPEPVKIRTDDLYTRCEWSPFAGMEMSGYCSDLIHKGELLKKDGQVLI